jgi:hypothetical protein
VDRIVTIKIAAYFFCVVGSALLSAMELKLQQSQEYHMVQKVLLCDEIMKKYEIPQDVTVVVKRDAYCSPRMDTIYKKFDPFFNFNAAGYRCLKAAHKTETRHSYFDDSEALSHIEKSCRKFWEIKPRTLFYFKDYQDEILSLLISRPGCFIHNEGNFHIILTEQEYIRVCLLPDEFQVILNKYMLSWDI